MNPVDRLSKDGLAIFLFHGVVEKSSYQVRNYTHKHLEKDFFHKVISDLSRKGHPLSIDEVVAHRSEGRAYPAKSFAITFDDGFENNFSVAAPILEELEVPATFYVTTSFVDDNAMSWIDRIEYCLERTAKGRICLPWNSEDSCFSNREEKMSVLQEIRGRVKTDPKIDIDQFVSDIFHQCATHEIFSSDDPLDKKMTWEQVKALHDSELFTVGGHSHRHRILSYLSPDELDEEISISVHLLQDEGKVNVEHYSYPEGMEFCYSPQVIQCLKEYGIVCSPSAIDGLNKSEDLFNLKRINVVP
jgi:peptidoglycan/xylan/chitin deacetylase (PgdA/CDA1 family)